MASTTLTFFFLSVFFVAGSHQSLSVSRCGQTRFSPLDQPILFNGDSSEIINLIWSIGIYQYNGNDEFLTADVLERGPFDLDIKYGATALGANGKLYHFGGLNTERLGAEYPMDIIYEIRKESDFEFLELNQKMSVRRMRHTAVSVGDSIFIFGGERCSPWDQYATCPESTIEAYNTVTGETTVVAHLTYLLSTAAIYDGEHIYIFGTGLGDQTSNSIHKFNPVTFQVELLPANLPRGKYFERLTAVRTNDNKAYIFQGNWTTYTDHPQEVFIFDPKTERVSKESVNFHIDNSHSSIYVPTTNTIYLFGAEFSKDDSMFKGIACIEPKKEFSCAEHPNGDYPHGSDCTKFITCSNGIAHERDCPANLHFNAQGKYCDYPDHANCNL